MDIWEYPMTYEWFKIYCYDKQIWWFNWWPTKPTYTGGVNLKNKPQPLTDEDIRNQWGGLLPYALTTLAKREAAHKSNDQDIQRFLDWTDKYLKWLRDIDQSYISELWKENSKTVDWFKKFCKSKIKRRQASVNQFSK
jgi:hypothetical protein